MWLSLFLIIMIGAIAYMQMLHGLFSALIMCVLSLLCSAFALYMYEWVAYSFLAGPLGDVALPVSLMATFLVPLVALRLSMDALVIRSGMMPMVIDRSLGAVLGVVTAFTVTGMLALAIQMVPFGGTILGYQALDPETGEHNSLWLSPDRFVVAMVSGFSDGVFSGSRRMSLDHPDLVGEVVDQRAGSGSVLHVAPADSVNLVDVERLDYIFDKTKAGNRRDSKIDYKRVKPSDGNQWYLVRLNFTKEAKDEDGRLRFSRGQIRLVGRDSPDEAPRNYLPVAMNDNDDPKYAVRIKDGKLYTDATDQVSLVFGVPERFSPMFLEYKTGARIDMTGQSAGEGTGSSPPMDEDGSSASGSSSSGSGNSTLVDSEPSKLSGGRVSGVRASAGRHKFSNALPTTMTSYQKFDLELKQGKFANGHVFGKTEDQEQGSGTSISEFDVPSDKRMFQLDVKKLRAGSTLGKALNFAVKTVKNYQVTDSDGNVYPVSGQFAVVDADGEEVIEIQYFPESVATLNRGGIRDFRLIKDRHMKSNYRLVYLFLVSPGAELVEFSVGRGKRTTDLRRENLVAPR